MAQRFAPATPKFPHMLHGGDYNPEQWLDQPEVLEEDIRLFRKAHINCVSLGIFSWAKLEPEEGVYDFGWLDEIIDRLYANGIYTVLATPSGARPQWLAQKYPEVLRVRPDGLRNFYGHRQNHCYTSPLYREKVTQIDTRLAEHYANHPAVILWHISNEFGGECHCELCQAAFREWVQKKYGTLDKLNHAWWANFWSHTYTDWSQVHSPSPVGETSVHGLDLDWRRFVTHQTIDFMKTEIAAVKAVNPDIPVTTNMMTMYTYELNYFAFRDALDVISWDNYPEWHNPYMGNEEVAKDCAMTHDMMRSLQKKPFLLMECTPNATNWQGVSKLKKPGMHQLSVIEAVAHGADSGQYFQLRQSRGSCEKFHSAVISNTGTENTRTFREVTDIGAVLEQLSDRVYGSGTPAETAILFDTENKWALDKCQGPRNIGLDYFGNIRRNYSYFWKNGINVDIIDSTFDLSGYKLVIAPMLYLFRDGIQEKLRRFVRDGGTLVTTCFTGVVNDTDLSFLGEATEDKLSDVLGLWVEEVDSLYDCESNRTTWNGKSYSLKELCEICHPTTCETLAVYETDFYAGKPVLTKNQFGKGVAYHVSASADTDFFHALYAKLAAACDLTYAIRTAVPDGVSLTWRQSDTEKLIFVQNFGDSAAAVQLDQPYENVLSGETVSGSLNIEKYGFAVLAKQI
ncbi:beta-galactosidase [uncultured Ruminococcus sp.]|uniref:beta-galactosidase n=1 Tax=uncultured Ruminococcus sp. TaxID=165186 RepID=UPI0025DA9C6D|nr:beta-galactosidase [uncultured Ruminococcus sp.]